MFVKEEYGLLSQKSTADHPSDVINVSVLHSDSLRFV